MTYKELNDRLSKCESTLEKIKNGTYKTLSKTELEETTKKLTLLRESLNKQLSDAVEFEKGKEQDAADFAKDNPDTPVKIVEEDIKFSIDETKAIAKKVGQAVALALKEAGDEIGTMKAKKIEPNSFEIYVEYKKDIATDEFSFYITDDTLHLTDFSFDKELVDVGVKPSGEALVNVDVLKNELVKHFASMRENIKEAPEGMYYIKIPRDAASQNKAQVIFNDVYGIDYEINDDPDGIVMYFKKEDYDPGLEDDLMGDQVKIIDTNMPLSEEKEMIKKEDMDVGHQDDEPGMLQTTAYETAQYAAKLVKKLQKYEQFDGEVDFPNWWQSKLILAKDYMQKAYHYLDSEEKQPAIDQLALEAKKASDGMTTKIKPSEGDPTNMAYTDKVKEGRGDGEAINNIIISMANEDNISTREAAEEIIDHITHIFIDTKGTDEGKYKSDAQRKAIYATKAEKEGVNEVDGDRFIRAAFEDLEQVIRNLAHTAEISEDEALEMAIRKLEAMLDGRDDMDEGVAKTKKAHDLVVNKMKELAKKYRAGDKSVIDQLKDLTAKKKSLEAMLDKDVADTGRGQELSEGRGDMDDIKSIIRDRAANSGFEEREEAAEVIAAIAEEYMLSLKVIQAYIDSDGPVNPQDVKEAELDKKEKKKLKDMSKSLKKSSKGHAGQAKYLDKLTKENA